jgi:hypothetical protein
MIKLKNIMNENYWTGRKFGEPLPKLRLEQDEPEHFGGGENIKILDYQTEHFDICRSAVILYQRLVKDVDNTDAQDLIVSSAKKLDHLFEMEKQVVRGEELDHDPINMGVDIINIVSYQLGRIAGMTNDDFERDTSFLKLHIMEIINRKDSIKIADKQEEEPVDENLKPHEKKISKAFKTTDKTEIKGIDRLIDMSQIGDVLKMQKKNPKDFKKMINRIGKM